MKLAAALLVIPSIALAAPTASVTETGNPLDLALDGAGYFAVQTPNGPRYTRTGSFHIEDARRSLVTSDGFAVRGDHGKPIVIPVNTTKLEVAIDGAVNVWVAAGRTTVGKLEIVRFTEVNREGTLFAATGSPEAGELPKVRSGMLEVQPSVAIPEPAPAPTTPAAPKLELAPEPSSSNGSLYAMIAIAALGLGVWYVRRRRGAQAPAASIDVIAERALGGRAKVVWFSAGGREMLVAITQQQVCVLGQWRKAETRAQLPEAHALADSKPIRAEKPMSAAVAGILRLRERADAKANASARSVSNHTTPRNPFSHHRSIDEINEDVATGDLHSDALWAKELLEATGEPR